MSKHSNERPGHCVRTGRERPADFAADRSTAAAGRRFEETLFQTLCRLAADWAR
jgi:hypothetical protein